MSAQTISAQTPMTLASVARNWRHRSISVDMWLRFMAHLSYAQNLVFPANLLPDIHYVFTLF